MGANIHFLAYIYKQNKGICFQIPAYSEFMPIGQSKRIEEIDLFCFSGTKKEVFPDVRKKRESLLWLVLSIDIVGNTFVGSGNMCFNCFF